MRNVFVDEIVVLVVADVRVKKLEMEGVGEKILKIRRNPKTFQKTNPCQLNSVVDARRRIETNVEEVDERQQIPNYNTPTTEYGVCFVARPQFEAAVDS